MKNAIYIIFACLLASCGLFDSHDEALVTDGSPIRTDKNRYSVDDRNNTIEIKTTYVNELEDSVVVNWCGKNVPPYGLLKKSGDTWVDVYGSICQSILGPLGIFAPGDSLQTRVVIFFDNSVTFTAEEIDGVYRLEYQMHSQSEQPGSAGELLPLEYRISNPFIIED